MSSSTAFTLWRLAAVGLVLLLGGVIYALYPKASRPPTAAAAQPAGNTKGIALVESARVVRGNLEPLFSSLGSIEPHRNADVFALAGGRVSEVRVELGDTVAAGDVLAVLDTAAMDAEVGELEAELAGLDRDGDAAAPRRDYLQARLKRLRLAVGEASLRAPIAGIVTRIDCAAGDVVGPPGESSARALPLFTIEDVSRVYAHAGISERFISQLTPGMPARARVGAYPLEHFPLAIFSGQVSIISPTLDPVTRTADVWVDIENQDGRLKPGMSVEVGLVLQRYEDVLLVPKEAVVKGEFEESEADLVYVIDDPDAAAAGKPSTVSARGVNLGTGDGVNYMLLQTGRAGSQEKQTAWVKEGDLVVTVGASGVVDGQSVRVVR